MESGLSAGLRTLAPCAISFSFAGWSSGTKLSSDMTRSTSGTFSSRASIFFASASELVMHVDGVGAGVRVLAQIEKGGDRFDLGIAQVDRVEVELQEIKQRQAGDRDQQRADDDDDAMLFEKMIDRRQERVADRLAFAGRVEQLQQRRQHGDAGDERDQHADAGDLAEFRNALVVGRQEAEEAGRGRHRRQRQRHRGAFGRLLQRRRADRRS